MIDKKKWFRFLISLLIYVLIISCADINHTKYKDTSDLEVPPNMEISERSEAKVSENDEIEKNDLANIVSYVDTEEKPVIKIKKLFFRSWNIVERALKLNKIKVKDKNRDLGIFYVLFDPDSQNSGISGVIDSITFPLFGDEHEEAAYKLTVRWHDSDTEVRAELYDKGSSKLLDDDENNDDFEGSVDEGTKLLEVLYKTIREDLPNN